MANRRKKKNINNRQKISKARHRNEFIRKIQIICSLAGCREAFHLIPGKELNTIYNLRCQTPHFQPVNKNEWSHGELRVIKKVFSVQLKEHFVPVVKDGLLISLNDHFTVGLTLWSYLTTIKDDEYSSAARLKELMQPFISFSHRDEQAILQLGKLLDTIGWISSDMCSKLYWAKIDVAHNKDNLKRFLDIGLYGVHPEKKIISVEGINRPVFRVGWGLSQTGITWLSIKAPDLDPENASLPEILDIYIQPHVLHRISERIDCLTASILQHHVYLSLSEVKAIRKVKNQYLIEFRIVGFKVGYLLASVEENILVIRTFLFLTNNGTPEGKKLYRNTGLKKLDKQFLAIDKASTFLTSDIWDNPELRRIFTESGCESLIGLSENEEFSNGILKVSDMIAKYIQLSSEEPDFVAETEDENLSEQFQVQEF